MSRNRQRVPLEHGQRIDINQLRRDGLMPRSLDGATAGTLRVSYPAINFEQDINFTSRPRHFGGRQFFFQCPGTGRRCSVLWKPPGASRFACRQAWGGQVAYAIQFADATNRCHLAQARIRAKLGAEWFDDMPGKPQRMRWKTYERLEARYEVQERKLDSLLLGFMQGKWSVLKDIV